MLLRLLPASSLPCGAGEAQGAAAKPSPSRLGGSPCAPPGAGSSAWSCWCHPGPSCRAGFGVFPPGCRAGGCELCFFGCARLRGGFLGGRGVPQQSFGPSPARLSCSCFPREAPGKTWDTSSTPGAAPAPCGAPFFCGCSAPGRGGHKHTRPHAAARLLLAHLGSAGGWRRGRAAPHPFSPALKAKLCSRGALAAGRLSASQMERREGLSSLPLSLPLRISPRVPRWSCARRWVPRSGCSVTGLEAPSPAPVAPRGPQRGAWVRHRVPKTHPPLAPGCGSCPGAA